MALGLGLVLLSRAEAPPRQPEDLCAIFVEKRDWYGSARRSFADWGVPEAVLMSVIYQESGFRARARPRRKYFWILPGPRPSTAYGYAQALDSTWQQYRRATGRGRAARHDFDDVAHFIGWYGGEIQRLAGIAKDDAYRFYLAYHEGPSGYARGSHRRKEWLLAAARKVEARADRYQRQYSACAARLRRRWPWRWLALGSSLILLAAWAWFRRRRAHRPGH